MSETVTPKHDTPLVDHIVNEMLGASSGFTDDRRVLFTYGELRGYLRRISAAAKREREAWIEAACNALVDAIRRGHITIVADDAAVMRRAAGAACKLIRDWWKDHRADADTAQVLNDVECALCKALDHRPRNCDRFGGETEAMVAFLNEVWRISVKSLKDDPFDEWTPEMKARYAKWLMEKEGAAK